MASDEDTTHVNIKDEDDETQSASAEATEDDARLLNCKIFLPIQARRTLLGNVPSDEDREDWVSISSLITFKRVCSIAMFLILLFLVRRANYD